MVSTSFRRPTSEDLGGVEWTVGKAFFGCVGALPGRGFEAETANVDREALTNILVVNPTCPCDASDRWPRSTEVIERQLPTGGKVDRHRMFNQRMPTDRDDRRPSPVHGRASAR